MEFRECRHEAEVKDEDEGEGSDSADDGFPFPSHISLLDGSDLPHDAVVIAPPEGHEPEVPHSELADRGRELDNPTPREVPAVSLETSAGRLKIWQRWLPVELTVTTATHSDVRVVGMARFFPANVVHLERSTGAVGNDCVLRQKEHFHLHHMAVSLDRLVESPVALKALGAALESPGDRRLGREFQEALRGLAGQAAGPEPDNQVQLKMRRACSVTTTASTLVLQDGARVNRTVDFISELTTIDAVALLAEDDRLVTAFIGDLASVDGPSRESLTKLFAGAARGVEDIDLIRGAEDLCEPGTTVSRSFKREVVAGAIGVLLGQGNRVEQSFEVQRPGGDPRLSHGFEALSEVAAEKRLERWEAAEREAAPAEHRPLPPELRTPLDVLTHVPEQQPASELHAALQQMWLAEQEAERRQAAVAEELERYEQEPGRRDHHHGFDIGF